MAPKSEGRKITGVSIAFVNVEKGAPPREFYEGDVLPASLPAGEIERLEELGVFGTHPRVEAEQRARVLAQAGLPAGVPLRSDEERAALTDRSRVEGDDEGDDLGDPLLGLTKPQLQDLAASRPDVSLPAKATKEQIVEAIHAADDRAMALTANPGADPTIGHGGDGRDPHADPSSE